MDVNATLPPDFEWYENQIAGHHPSVVRNGLRQIGILKHKSRADIILKLVQEGARGQRELELYERVEAIGKSENGDGTALKVLLLLRDLYTFLPRFYGCTDIRLNEKDSPMQFLQIEDITQTFKWPCIMDVKIGRVSYDPDASEEKKLAEESKSPLQKIVGFRILGYRNQSADGIQHRDRVWGRERTQENIEQAFEEFLTTVRSDSLIIVEAFLSQLERIHDWFQRQGILHFYASSLLFVYEGYSTLPPVVSLRMIDFSHVFFRPTNGFERDENYLYGIVHIIKLFRNIRDHLSLTTLGKRSAVEGPMKLERMLQNGTAQQQQNGWHCTNGQKN